MRIQHNIMAMNAYRNYNNNTSALSKNLEKLSSGYRINRAGDDAAGLAISEKMRAQITALGAAQKNVKDGISLVKTAEGATQEIHDMLNRMVSLAEQSANGTYQNKVDREAITDEFNALKSEIDRISKASNFNGIKLLNGDQDNGATAAVEATTGNFELPETGSLQGDLGTKTITHASASAAAKTTFGVELGDITFSNRTGESMSISIGDYTISIGAGAVGDAAAGDEVTAKDIVKAFTEATDNTGNVKGADGLEIKAAGKVEIDGITFDVAANATGTGLVFTQTGDGEVNGDMAVDITTAGTDAVPAGDLNGKTIADDAVKVGTAAGAGVTGTWTLDFDGLDGIKAGNYTVSFEGVDYNIALTQAEVDADAADAVAAKFAAAVSGALDDSLGGKYTAAAAGSVVTFTSSAAGNHGAGDELGAGKQVTIAIGEASEAGGVKGTYNTKTTETVGAVPAVDKALASTVITLTKDMVSDGAKVRFGETEYTFTSDATKKATAGMVYVGDLKADDAGYLSTAIDRLSVAAKDNAVWAVGYDGNAEGKVTVTEKADNTGKGWMDQNAANKAKYDLSTVDGIKKSLGYTTAKKEAYAGDPTKGLTLQIGDTSDDYNQLTVAIAKMDSEALGLNALNLGTQEGAQAAVSVIKDAINTVSSTRGKLGALQNRLEHTGNNLSTMKENIQDAEATIRDTDIAEEMMAYTKNNILVQSAQAMLAQANQIPQGVLQLLG